MYTENIEALDEYTWFVADVRQHTPAKLSVIWKELIYFAVPRPNGVLCIKFASRIGIDASSK